MFKALLKTTLVAAAVAAPQAAFAWGQDGHRITGYIAQEHLTAKAHESISEILGNETLTEVSTWADFMRSSDEDFWKKAGPFHYVTIPVDVKYEDVGAPEQGDAVSALETFKATLKDPSASLEDKKLALKFTVHLIGDVHQPLHAGNGTDRGGNDHYVKWFGKSSNLHRVWDSQMLEGQRLSYSEYGDRLLRRIDESTIEKWSDTNPVNWVNESAGIRDTIYPDKGAKLSYDYTFEHRVMIEEQLSKSGIRMAAYLNELFAQ
ncbi:S1/P1 nuclease [Flexibacterium corallicola]|uniref:S1/P1 nuclease n=1 Tax=Flexibacterium corallicola TaxID=3037259 RepID=UPI00286FAC17|nr:S1/P1 nuclease [Pseudovibrio sp. M1P-2-3]